ncbi:acyl-CoA dehydrogenase family protein [Nocardia sp. NPDC058176]|uniref:acyl-CoA dehydrogenase family protein n=1 Tax=Nocardia sp. NPDC058176 TaxID=3346368 RepID=UPI0036DD64E8
MAQALPDSAAPSVAHAAVAGVEQELRRLADPVDKGECAPALVYDTIRASGLLAALVPVDRGGMGLSFAEYTSMLCALGSANGSAALGFNMHNVALGSLFEADPADLGGAGRAFREWVVHEVVERGALFASGVSEPATGARLQGIATVYRNVGDRVVLDGHKSFVSLAGVADYYVVSARPADGDDFEVSHFVVAASDPGVSFADEWNGIALRGTSTAQLTMRSTEIPRDRLFLGVEGMSLFKTIREPHWMAAGYLGAYLGLATAIVEVAGAHLDADQRRRTDSAAVAQFGEMVVALEATRSLVQRAAAAVVTRRSQTSTNKLVYAAKHHLGQTAQHLASDAVRLIGSAAMAADKPMQRLLREVQFCAIMPAKPHHCLDYVGKASLGENMLDVRNQNW